MNYEVNVVAFNPPKLGSVNLVTSFRNRLKARPRNFRISVLTREGDPVDDVPLDGPIVGFYHPLGIPTHVRTALDRPARHLLSVRRRGDTARCRVSVTRGARSPR